MKEGPRNVFNWCLSLVLKAPLVTKGMAKTRATETMAFCGLRVTSRLTVSSFFYVKFFPRFRYATRESNTLVKIYKNFKEKKTFKPDFGAEGKMNRFSLLVLQKKKHQQTIKNLTKIARSAWF